MEATLCSSCLKTQHVELTISGFLIPDVILLFMFVIMNHSSWYVALSIRKQENGI